MVIAIPAQNSDYSVLLLKVTLRESKPNSPAVSDEINMTSFELLMITSLSKASKVIKIDIVNPIPANNPTLKIDFQFKSVGSLLKPNRTARNVATKIPTGLPTINPSAMPRLLGLVNVSMMFPLNKIAVLAKANMGRIINATGLCKKCCKMEDVDFSSPSPNGIVNASNTPVMVA